jgi:protease-4
MRKLGKFVIGLFATIGVIVMLLVGVGIYAVTKMENRHAGRSVPDHFILTMNLDRGFDEEPETRGFMSLGFGNRVKFQDAVIALKRAKDDPRVVAVAATLSEQHIGFARTQELRDLIAQIRAAGKPTMLFSESIGEGTGVMRAYYLASAFGDIWVQPSGSVGVAGIGLEQPFLRKALDHIGLSPNFIQRKEYKSATENLTAASMSPANREETEALVNGWFDQMVTGVAADRRMTPDAVKALVDKGPLTPQEAKAGGLIDDIGYRDEFEAALRRTTRTAPRVTLTRYADIAPPPGTPQPTKTVAVITAAGQIERGGQEDNPFEADGAVKSRIMAKAIRDAVANPKVAAIILRIDSPGGSYVASDTIWREVVRAKESKKPVVVSMGDVAASGGYFIAMSANRIFAAPGTITGSIGVLSGKMVFAEASEKLNINWERVAAGESAGLFSPLRDFTPQELARMNQIMDIVYADFTTKAAQGRNLDPADLEKVAKGRVWTGADALKARLVDELGGFSQALDYTKTLIGLKPTDPVWLLPYPKPEDPWEKVFKAISDEDTPANILTTMRAAVQISKVLTSVQAMFMGTQAQGPQLQMTPVEAK